MFHHYIVALLPESCILQSASPLMAATGRSEMLPVSSGVCSLHFTFFGGDVQARGKFAVFLC